MKPITAKASDPVHPPKVISRQVTPQVLHQHPIRLDCAAAALQLLRKNPPRETQPTDTAVVPRITLTHLGHGVVPIAWDIPRLVTHCRRTWIGAECEAQPR